MKILNQQRNNFCGYKNPFNFWQTPISKPSCVKHCFLADHPELILTNSQSLKPHVPDLRWFVWAYRCRRKPTDRTRTCYPLPLLANELHNSWMGVLHCQCFNLGMLYCKLIQKVISGTPQVVPVQISVPQLLCCWLWCVNFGNGWSMQGIDTPTVCFLWSACQMQLRNRSWIGLRLTRVTCAYTNLSHLPWSGVMFPITVL